MAQWASLRPPLTAMPEERARELAAVLERGFEFEAMPTRTVGAAGDIGAIYESMISAFMAGWLLRAR